MRPGAARSGQITSALPLAQTAPPMHRGSIPARPWTGFVRGAANGIAHGVRARLARPTGQPAAAPVPRSAWEQAAATRRRVLLALIAASATAATTLMLQAQPASGHPLLQAAQTGLFALLFAWVSAGFYTALMGFVVQFRGDRHALSAQAVRHHPLAADARTAIIMPICNEQVDTVFKGLRATIESLVATREAGLFDVFVLSDSSRPEVQAAEEAAWTQLKDEMGPEMGARIHYRWRRIRSKRKAGNVADFCRRWGRDYRYMIVLDADSVMSGDCLTSLVRLMEAHPTAGIIQTAPQASGLDTLHARAQQFATRVVGRLFTAGMQYWQLGESHYWGHNAIIRIEPFMQHCGLAPLPGHGGLSGEILSHDFVEAALMRRAGWHVWLVTDLCGSYEQVPPNLADELARDRRWCQGNLQNARLLAEPGLHAVHRAMLATGVLAYASAPLWLGFVLLGLGLWLAGGTPWLMGTLGLGQATENPALLALWVAMATLLFLPRVLGVLVVLARGEHKRFGGRLAVMKGALLEAGLSVLLAPIRMVAHTLFVLAALTGLKLEWKSPPREAEDLSWADAARRYARISAGVAVLCAVACAIDPAGALWLAPMSLPLLLAIPLSVYTSRATLGRRLQESRWLLTPEETWPPAVLRRAWGLSAHPAIHPVTGPLEVPPLPANVRVLPVRRAAAPDDFLEEGNALLTPLHTPVTPPRRSRRPSLQPVGRPRSLNPQAGRLLFSRSESRRRNPPPKQDQ